MLADQMLDRIEYMHSKGILHCDIKPENLLMGLGHGHMKFISSTLVSPWSIGTQVPISSYLLMKHTQIKNLCHGYPPEFASYFCYCHSLRFDEAPDYAHLNTHVSRFVHPSGFHVRLRL